MCQTPRKRYRLQPPRLCRRRPPPLRFVKRRFKQAGVRRSDAEGRLTQTDVTRASALSRRVGIPVWSQGSKLCDKSASKAELEKESAGRSYPSSAVLLSNYSNCFWRYFLRHPRKAPGLRRSSGSSQQSAPVLKKNVFWRDGGRGIGGNWGEGACQDRLGVIVQWPRLRLRVWSQPRCRPNCGLIPVRKSRRETSLGAWDKGALVVVGAGLVSIAVPPSTPGTPRRSSRKYAFFGRGHSLIFWLQSP